MIFKKHGLSVRILDSDDEEIPEYQVAETEANTIECWIPSVEGSNFKIRWEAVKNRHKKYDLLSKPFLDGIRMRGTVASRDGRLTGLHYMQITGKSTARLYEFGRRIFTDSDDYAKPDMSVINSLNTIKLVFEWGYEGATRAAKTFRVPPEIGPMHEKAAKKGHSGAAILGKEISISRKPTKTHFDKYSAIKPVTFVFRYAPEDWLRARDIIPHSPEPDLPDIETILKRERADTPDIIDIDDLETDDDDIQIIKHMVPAPIATNKRQRTSEQGSFNSAKKEED